MGVDLNSFALVGRVTRDAEVRTTKSGKQLTFFSVAVNDDYKETKNCYFFECKMFNDFLAKYLLKGTQVAINGKMTQERWEKDGQKFSKVTLLVDSLEFVGGHSSSDKCGEQSSGYTPC